MPAADVYLTRSQAALVAGVSTNTVKHWYERGWLDRDGNRRHLRTRRTSRGWLEYHYGDVLAAERDTRRSGHSRRRPARGLVLQAVA